MCLRLPRSPLQRNSPRGYPRLPVLSSWGEYQLINSCKACWCMLYAWIYRENNTRDPCEHRKDQPAHHSKKGLMPPCGWRHYTQARSCLGRVDPGPEPSLSQAGNEGPAWRREEAPSRASPAGNQLTRQKGKPQPQGEESPNRSSPRKLFSAVAPLCDIPHSTTYVVHGAVHTLG